MIGTAVPAGTNHHLVQTPAGVELRRSDGTVVATLPEGSLMAQAYDLAKLDDERKERLSHDVRYEPAICREDLAEPIVGRRAPYPPVCGYCLRPRTPLGPHNCTEPKGENPGYINTISRRLAAVFRGRAPEALREERETR